MSRTVFLIPDPENLKGLQAHSKYLLPFKIVQGEYGESPTAASPAGALGLPAADTPATGQAL